MTMKRKLFGILLSLALAMGLMLAMSLTAYADSWDGNPYASIVNTTNTVKFNGLAWYVIEDNSTAANEGTLTLLARDPLCARVFNNGDRYTDNIDQYSNSDVRNYLDGLTTGTGSFAGVADAIVPVDLPDVNVTGAKLWLLSLEQAQTLFNTNKFVLICTKAEGTTSGLNYCWTRTKTVGSPDGKDNKIRNNTLGFFYSDNGKVKGSVNGSGLQAYNSANVRPALKLDLSKVTLSNVTVTLSGGANATTTGGGRIQRFFGSDTKIETVYYHGGTCCTFPATSEYYTTTDGITVEYVDSKTLKVSGTPTKDDVTITIPDATASHNFGYTASGATITAGCKTSGCPARSSFDPVKLTIAAPDDDGSSTEATLTNLDAFNSATNLSISANDIKYYNATKSGSTYTKNGDALTGAPTASGDYLAEITVSGATASVGYTAEVPRVDVTEVTLDKTTVQTINVSGKVSFTATVTPDNATDKSVKWSVTGTAVTLYSNENCTTGTEVGTDATSTLTVYAKGMSEGTATVTVTATNGTDDTEDDKSASCDVTAIKGYGGAALPAGPDMSGDVINVNAANAQYTLDGAYGNINGKTINFTESVTTSLDLARPTKYVGSGTTVNGTTYTRALSGVKFTSNENVTLAGFHCTTGNTAETVNKDVIYLNSQYDYVKDRSGNYTRNNTLTNITFDGLNITSSELAAFFTFGKTNTLTLEGINITNCTITNSNGHGLYICSLDSDCMHCGAISITNCIIQGTGSNRSGVIIEGVGYSNTVLTNNYIVGSHNAIQIENPGNASQANSVTVTGNYMKANDYPVNLYKLTSNMFTFTGNAVVAGNNGHLGHFNGDASGNFWAAKGATPGANGRMTTTLTAPTLKSTSDSATSTSYYDTAVVDTSAQKWVTLSKTHTHAWATAWTNDATYHWHACTGDGATDACLNETGAAKAEHTYGDTGDARFTCTVCEYVDTTKQAEAEAADLAAAKTTAKNDLDTLLGEKTEADYDADDWTTLTTAITNGKAAIDNATTIDDVTTEKNNAVNAVNAIKTKAEKVADAINALPAFADVTAANKEAIEAARAAYNALTADQQEKVSADTLKKLTDAEAALTAEEVKTEIENLPTASAVTSANKEAIAAARTEYDALSDAQKTQVGDDAKAKLEACEAALAIAELPAASDVKASDKTAIEAARAAYDALSDAQKTQVGADAKAKLEACETALIGSTSEEIAKIGQITEENKDDIEGLLDFYNSLTDDEKDSVDKNIGRAGTKKLADLERALGVVDKIDKIPAVDNITTSDEKAITLARTAYELLSESQKAMISPDLITKLKTAENKLEELKGQDALKAEKASAIDRLNDYSQAKALEDATKEESDYYAKEVAKGVAAINASENKEAVEGALTNAKKTVDDALAKIKGDRASAAAAAAEMAAADKALADAKSAAETAKAEAVKAVADEYVSETDKTAINTKKTAVETKVEAANALLATASAADKNAAAKAIEDAVKELNAVVATANENSAAAQQLAAAKASAIDRLNDYSQAKALLVATEAEKKAYEDAVFEGIAAINEAADKKSVENALTDAKAAVAAALAKIEKDRADAAAVAAEMAAADKAVADARTAAATANKEADEAKADKYASETDKGAIDTAKAVLEAKIKAADELPADAKAEQKNAAAQAIEEAIAALKEKTSTAVVNSAAAKAEAEEAATAAQQLVAAKASAIDRLDDYSEAKALADASDAEKAAYDKAVADSKKAINDAADKDAVATELTNAKKAVDAALATIRKDREDAAAAAAEMDAADNAVANAKTAAETANKEADEAKADEYASDADKNAIDTAKATVEAKIKAANDLPKDATAKQKTDAAKAIEDAVKALDDAIDTANVNSATARAAAEEAATAAQQLAAAKASAIDRLDDYSEAKVLADASDAEKAAYDKAVADGKKAINDATDKDKVATALTNAKKAVDAALAKIEKDRADAAAAAEEMAAADKAVANAKAAAETANKAADEAKADKYASETDKSAIDTAKATVEAKIKAANDLPKDATAKQKTDAAKAIEDAVKALDEATDTANVHSTAAKATADEAAIAAAQLAAAKDSAIDRLDDYSEAKALADANDAEKAAYDKAVADGKKAINDAADKDKVATALTNAKKAVDAALATIRKDREDAAAAAAEMDAADNAVANAKTAAETANKVADEAKADEYASDADKNAIDTAKATVEAKIKAANDLPKDATAKQKADAAKAIEDAVKALDDAIDTANVNSAAARAAAEEAATAEQQLASAKASAIDRLDDYSEAKALADATAAEKAAYKKAIDDGITAITGAADKDKVTAALENAKRAVDAALANIETARADAAKAEAEMNAAEKTLSDANKAAEDAAAAAAAATADEYASDADKQAISDAKTAVDNAIDAAKALPQNATAKQKADAAKAIEDAVKALGDATDTAGINSAAARTAAEEKAGKEAQLEAAKTYAKDRLEDYSEAKALSDFSKAEKKAYKKAVDKGIASINAAADEDAVAAALTSSKRAVDKAIEKIKKDRAEAKAKKVKNVTVNVATVSTKSINAAVKKAGGKAKYVKTIVLGKNVKKINAKAFTKYKKAKTLQVKTSKLKKKTVKNSLKGSKVTTIKVKVSSKKKTNKKYVKKYKKIFTAKNAGKSVKVVAA